jgi:hypothetical protein
VLVPLVALLLVLSAWPAAITDRSFPKSPAQVTTSSGTTGYARFPNHRLALP